MKIDKVTWEADHYFEGVVVQQLGVNEKWIIAYDATKAQGTARYTLVSLSDGMIGIRRTKKRFIQHLNEQQYLPVELIELIEKFNKERKV